MRTTLLLLFLGACGDTVIDDPPTRISDDGLLVVVNGPAAWPPTDPCTLDAGLEDDAGCVH